MEDSEKRRRCKPERNKEGRQRLGGNERETANKNDVPNQKKVSERFDETLITSQRELITQQKKCRQQPYKQLACDANMLLGGTGHSHSLLKMN